MKELLKYKYSQEDWSNIDIIQRNRMAVRPFYNSYEDRKSALIQNRHQSSRFLLLNGLWKFSYLESPFQTDDSFISTDFEDSSWDDIAVPSHWQLSGYGQPQYTDAVSPFPVQKEPIIQTNNPTGLYRHKFSLMKEDEMEYIIRFDGVESAYHLWINGHFAGYSQGSRLSAEFNIGDFLTDGENTISMKVYKYCDGSYIENQDMWWLAGIIRDVSLIYRPKIHINRYTLTSDLCMDRCSGDLKVSTEIENNTNNDEKLTVCLELLDDNKTLYNRQETINLKAGEKHQFSFSENIMDIQSWNAETPKLYSALLSLHNDDNTLKEYCPVRVGFRSVQVEDGLIKVNGKAIKFRGVNRHDWNVDTGRVVTIEQMMQDLLLMKRNNINAVRSAHYPNQPDFYDLCDQLGLYVMEEADIECNQTYYWEHPDELSDDPRWTESYLDRISRMVERDINHCSTLFWSLGNESGYGRNFKAAYEMIKSLDPTRPVHYEEDRDAVSADMFSTMYTNHEKLKALGQQDLPKPHILCEYAHAMGNGPGGLMEYWDIFKKYPRLQGGFVWEWKDHSLSEKSDTGERYYTYGGDYGDSPNSGAFCSDGLIQADGLPTPGLTHLKKALEQISAVDLNLQNGSIRVKNDYDFISLSGSSLHISVRTPKAELLNKEIKLPEINAGDSRKIIVFKEKELSIIKKCPDEKILHIGFYRPPSLEGGLIEAEETAFTQFILPSSNIISKVDRSEKSDKEIILNEQNGMIKISLDEISLNYDRINGIIHSFSKGDENFIEGGFPLDFWRAPVDNDKNMVPYWQKYQLDHIKSIIRQITVTEESDGIRIKAEKIYAPIVMEWSVESVEELFLSKDGILSIELSGNPLGKLPDNFPRIGLRFLMNSKMQQLNWFGRGPVESYIDAYEGAAVGLYESTTDENYFPYVVPQEHGNHSDVRWLYMGKKNGLGLCITAADLMNFNAGHYSREVLEKATHSCDLKRSEQPYLNLDLAQHGLGSASWGPETLEKHWLKPEKFNFKWSLCISEREQAVNSYSLLKKEFEK